jgi:molybdopterin-guanine dinucleotide biosynthesis protein MobB
MDREGSDTDRLFDAGASAVMATSPGGASARYRQPALERPLEDVIAWWEPDCDVVIAEGFKQSRVPKVLVEGGDTVSARISNVVARVDGHGAPAEEVPVFTFEQMDELCDLIESMMSTSLPDRPAARLTVDGQTVRLNRFPASALANVVTGFVSALKGVPGPERSIKVTVDLGHRDRTEGSGRD